MSTCAVCDKHAPSQCSGCQSIQYCGADHQHSHWPSHKAACKAIRKMKETGKGFIKEIINKGDASRVPAAGDTVTCHYVGTLLSGKEFDSSRAKDSPFNFELGKGRVIRAWDEGVATMCIGERATLFCSPEFGYGARGAGGVIPPNAYLVFDVELLASKSK